MLNIKPNTIFIDPPWGGICYRKNDLLRLSLSDVPIEELVLDIFNKFRTINISPLDSYSNRLVVLKLPKNYDIENFYHYIKKNIADKNYIVISYVYILTLLPDESEDGNPATNVLPSLDISTLKEVFSDSFAVSK